MTSNQLKKWIFDFVTLCMTNLSQILIFFHKIPKQRVLV